MFKSTRIAAVLGAAVLCFGVSVSGAQATEQYSCAYGTGSLADLNADPNIYSSASYNNLCGSYTSNQNSAVATSVAVLKAAASQSARLIGDRVANAMNGGSGFNVAANGFSASTDGMAAGSMDNKLGVWVAGSWSDVEDNNTDTAFDGDVYTTMVGVDYKISGKAVVGVSAGYEDVDFDTAYNGFGGVDGNIESDGWTVAPYVGVQLAPNAYANLTVGYSELDYDTDRYDPLTGVLITGSTDSERYFVSGVVGGNHRFTERWNLAGRLGVFYASEEKDAFTESEAGGVTIAQAGQDFSFGQATLDARLGYVFDMVEPYALAGVEFDFSKDEAPVGFGESRASLDDEDFGAKFGGGLNLRLGPNVTGGVEAYTVEFRDDYEEVTATAGLRVNF